MHTRRDDGCSMGDDERSRLRVHVRCTDHRIDKSNISTPSKNEADVAPVCDAPLPCCFCSTFCSGPAKLSAKPPAAKANLQFPPGP
jgi:hypothetical protein